MARTLDRHLDEEGAERYSMGKVSAGDAAQIEEHLLSCEGCRGNVAAADVYVTAMRLAAAKVRNAERKPKRHAARKAG